MMGTAVAEMNLGAKAFGFGPKDDPTAILPGTPTGFRIGSRTTPQGYGAGAERQANRYEGTSACPAGQVVVSHGSTPIRAAYIGAPTSSPFVYCKPIPRPGPAAPAPVVAGPTYTTTISPVLQTEISPQISPVFQQVQDSPGSVQAATPTMVAPGGMEAEGGSAGAGNGSAAMLEFMRMQSEQDAARRQEEAAARERERVTREQREYEYQKAQLDFQREQAAIANQRQAAIDAGAAEEAARLEAQYQAAQSEWEKTSATPGGMVATAVMPGREMIGMEVPAPMGVPVKPGLPMPLILAGVAALAVGGYFIATQAKGKKRKAK